MLGDRAHEGLQPPSNPKERKGLKEAQSTVQVHSAAHPHPPRTRGAISASLEGLPPRPSKEPRISASLEAAPRRKGQTALPLARPPYGGIKCQPLLRSARVRRCQAFIPHSGYDRSSVHQLRSLLHHSERCGATVGTCDAVRDVLGTAPTTVLPTPRTSLVLSPPRNPRTAWARPSEVAPTLTRVGPPPAGPSERRHAARWSRQDASMISARPRTLPRTTATPGAIPHSVLPAVLDHCTPAIRGKDDDFRDLLPYMYTAPLCVYKWGRWALSYPSG